MHHILYKNIIVENSNNKHYLQKDVTNRYAIKNLNNPKIINTP